MPKIVDHDERRAHVGEAVWRVIATRGADAVTVREVALEAGVSPGILSHYFASRQQMLLHALQLSYRRASERLHDRIAAIADPDEALREALRSILPMTTEQAAEYRVWLCFWGHAVGDPQLDAANSEGYERTISTFETLVRRCQRVGTIDVSHKPRREARMLVALADGLAVQAVLGKGLAGREQMSIVDAALARMRR
jgi:AcrR family transcriptional regulator